jgi:hypothetical protein
MWGGAGRLWTVEWVDRIVAASPLGVTSNVCDRCVCHVPCADALVCPAVPCADASKRIRCPSSPDTASTYLVCTALGRGSSLGRDSVGARSVGWSRPDRPTELGLPKLTCTNGWPTSRVFFQTSIILCGLCGVPPTTPLTPQLDGNDGAELAVLGRRPAFLSCPVEHLLYWISRYTEYRCARLKASALCMDQRKDVRKFLKRARKQSDPSLARRDIELAYARLDDSFAQLVNASPSSARSFQVRRHVGLTAGGVGSRNAFGERSAPCAFAFPGSGARAPTRSSLRAARFECAACRDCRRHARVSATASCSGS